MKQYLLFIIFYMVGTSVEGQDYLPVPEGRELYFQTEYMDAGTEINNSNCLEDCVIGMKVDSVKMLGTDTDYYFVKMVRGDYIICAENSWLGEKMRLTTDGSQVYKNRDNHPILLKPQDTVGATWNLYDFQDGTFFEGQIVERIEMEVLGEIDTIVSINMILKNLTGAIIEHPHNDRKIKLGKNMGLIEGHDFYSFPNQSTTIDSFPKNLIGYRDPVPHGLVTPTVNQIYNLEIGNQYDYEDRRIYGFLEGGSMGYRRHNILDKISSVNEDTIDYLIDRTIYKLVYDPGYPVDTTFTQDTFTQRIILSNVQYLESIPFEPIGLESFDYQGFVNINNIDGRMLVNRINYLFSDGDCFMSPIGTGPFTNTVFAPCIGVYEVDDSSNPDFWTKLVYYKKGNEEWGTPIDFDALTPINEVFLPEQTFKVFPNPVSDYITISSDDFQNEMIDITLYSIDGQKLLHQQKIFADNLQLQIKNNLTGITILKISTSKGQHITKLKLQQN